METMFMYIAECVLVYGMTSTGLWYRHETKITQAQLNVAKGGVAVDVV